MTSHSFLQKVSILSAIIWISFLIGCQGLTGSLPPTPYPTEYLPTVVAMTLAAEHTLIAANASPTTSISPLAPLSTETPSPKQIAQEPTPTSVSNTPTATIIAPTEASQPQPPEHIPLADIQVYNLGQLSRVISPITLSAYLKPGAEGKVQVELLGEDRRVLVRIIKVLRYVDRDGKASLYMPIPFEIPGTAEAGRLVITVMDAYGRTTALTSIPLILMSIGETDIFPSADNLTTLFIQVPAPKTVIQGKSMVVFGWARTSSDGYLMAELITEDGRVVGKRVTKLGERFPNGYGNFTAEVPFTISEPKPALLVVWEGEENLSNIINLSSVEVMLSP